MLYRNLGRTHRRVIFLKKYRVLLYDLKITLEFRLASTSKPSCLCFLIARILDKWYHSWLKSWFNAPPPPSTPHCIFLSGFLGSKERPFPAWWPGTLECSHNTSLIRGWDPPLHWTNYIWFKVAGRREMEEDRKQHASLLFTAIVVSITISPKSSKWRYLRQKPAVASFLVTKIF